MKACTTFHYSWSVFSVLVTHPDAVGSFGVVALYIALTFLLHIKKFEQQLAKP